jgi:hypothetical protein
MRRQMVTSPGSSQPSAQVSSDDDGGALDSEPANRRARWAT